MCDNDQTARRNSRSPRARRGDPDRMIFFGEKSMHRAVRQFLEHYHAERNHQVLDNDLIAPEAEVGQVDGLVHRRKRLGGMLSYYYREAA